MDQATDNAGDLVSDYGIPALARPPCHAPGEETLHVS